MPGFFVFGIVLAAPYIVKTYRKPPADCIRQTWSPLPAARPLDRARCIGPRTRRPGAVARAWWPPIRAPGRLARGPRSGAPGGRSVVRGACLVAAWPWPLVRDPWAGGRAWCALVPGPWSAIRGPWRVPGGRAARPGGPWPACLVRLVARAGCARWRVPGGPWPACLVARALVRGPRRVRPGGPRPWRVRLVARPPARGPRPPVPGPRPPPPGPKNGPGRVLRGLLPDFTQSVSPKTVFRILVSRETTPWKKGPL